MRRILRIFLQHIGTWAKYLGSLILSDQVHKIAIVIIAIMASYFSFQSLTKRDYLLLTSPVEGEVISGKLQINGIWLRTPIAYSVRLEAKGEVIKNRSSLPAVWDSTQFPDGTYHVILEIIGRVLFFRVRAQMVSVEFRIDNTPPSLAVKNLEDGEVIKGRKEFSVRAEGGFVRDVIIDGIHQLPIAQGTFVEVSLDTALLSDGKHEVHLIASDSIGNTEDRIMWFVVDDTPPKIISLGPAEELPLRGEVTIQPAIDDLTLAEQTWWIDNEIISHESPLVLKTVNLSDGAHTVRLEATDQSGLTSQYKATIYIDNTSPVIRLTKSSPCQEVVSRVIYIDGKTLKADQTLEIYKRTPGDNISVQIIDNLRGDNISFLKMGFIVRRSMANIVNQFLGETIGHLLAYHILPFIQELTGLPSLLDIAGFSIGTEASACPPIPPVWNKLGETIVHSYRYPMVEINDVQWGCMEGVGICILLQRLSSLRITQEGVLEISSEALTNQRSVDLALEFGTMQGVYEDDLLEKDIIRDYVHETWKTSRLEEGWIKVGYRLERRPFMGISKNFWLSRLRIGWEVGLKAIQLSNIEMTHMISYNKATRKMSSDETLDWSTDQFFQLTIYWKMDLGLGF